MVLSVLTAMAIQAAEAAEVAQMDDEALPLGFLEFLGGMVEVEGSGQQTLLDPLDFEDGLDPDSQRPEADMRPEQPIRQTEDSP